MSNVSRASSLSPIPPSPFMSTEAQAAAPSARQREFEHIDDVDAVKHQQDVLIPPWMSHHRQSRSSALPSANQPSPSSQNSSVIQSYQNNLNNNVGQDVPHPLRNDSAPSHTTSSTHYRDVLPNRPFGNNLLSSAPSHPPQNGTINAPSHRLRTQHPVFGTASELAAHHGIPRKLPPTPRVNSVNNFKPPVPRFNETVPNSEPSPSSSTNHLDSFQNLMSNYVNMLSRNPDENMNASQSPAMPSYAVEPTAEEAAQSIASLLASPDLWMSEYLTSPFDDESPLEGLLETPAQGSADDFFTSPVVADINSTDASYRDLPLFPQASFPDTSLDFNKMSVSTMPQSHHLAVHNLDGLYTMSPATPALDPSSILQSPAVNDSPIPNGFTQLQRSRSKAPTGTRKNVTPETLVPLDAPTQPRNYVAPSATSRKEIPAVFARKRARSTAFGDEEDELADDPNALPPSENEVGAIAAKRRQNTLAARRSRKRKLEYQQTLEATIEQERREKEVWKQRALMCQAQLASMGVAAPFVDDA